MGLRPRHIEHGRAIAIDPQRQKLGGDQAIAQFHGARGIGTGLHHLVERRQELGGQRRAQALHPASLLVGEDRGVPADGGAQLGCQRPELLGALDVAGEEDEAKGVGLGEEAFLLGAQRQAERGEDGGSETGHRVVTGMQSAFSATKAAQKRRASARSAKPAARRR